MSARQLRGYPVPKLPKPPKLWKAQGYGGFGTIGTARSIGPVAVEAAQSQGFGGFDTIGTRSETHLPPLIAGGGNG